MTEVHADATTCPACSAFRGVWDRPVESWRKTSVFLLGLAAVIAFLGLALGTWIASADERTNFFDGMIAFLLLPHFMLFFGSIGVVMRYVIPRMQEGWYR